jgi:hypothetical protein
MSEPNYKLWDDIRERDPTPEGPRGWIQWKGTDVCIDLQCQCGSEGHFDGDFLYWWQCSSCGTKYAVSPNVRLIPLTDAEAEMAEEHVGFKTCQQEDDE